MCFRVASESDETTSSAATATATNHVFLEEHLLRHLTEIREETASIKSSVSMQLIFSFRYLKNVTHGEIVTVRCMGLGHQRVCLS